MFDTFLIFKKNLAEVSTRPIGENSPNLATLVKLAPFFHYFSKNFFDEMI
jgi:hypothetical protein